jgi:hypothetical protein
MTIPSHPFELSVYGRDGHLQIREYPNLSMAMEAINTLRPATTQSYRLSIVVMVHVFPRQLAAGQP